MKKHFLKLMTMVFLTVAPVMILTGCGGGNEKESLTVFNYGMYIDMNVLEQFTEETGIEIKYEEAPTPEELYTKYKSGAIQYDVLCTSEYMLQRLIEEGELKEIDFSTMEHTANIGDTYWAMLKSFDPENKYVMPYFWGTVGILYDKEKIGKELDSWEVLFDGSYADDFIMQNSMRDAYMIALKYLGYSMNTTDENELKEAQKLLIAQKDDVSAYLVDEVRDEVIAGNASLGVVYSGEAFYAYEEDPRFSYCIPREGTNIWIDCWGMTKDCKNEENAKKFLDFLCRDDIAKANYDEVKYASPIRSLSENLTESEKNSDAINPSPEKLENCEIYTKLPQETTDLLSNLWKELKAE